MRDLCVIFYGQTLMIDVAGVFHLEELDILLVRILLNNLTIPIT
jgi:hypothetical protein